MRPRRGTIRSHGARTRPATAVAVAGDAAGRAAANRRSRGATQLPRSDERGPEPAAWAALSRLLRQRAGGSDDGERRPILRRDRACGRSGASAGVGGGPGTCARTGRDAGTRRWPPGGSHADDQRALQSLLRQPLEALTADERDALTRGLIATARGGAAMAMRRREGAAVPKDEWRGRSAVVTL